MHSLHRVLGLLLVLVPGVAASCSGDETTNVAASGGENSEGGDATAGKSTTGGKNTTGGTSTASAGAGGDGSEANGGTPATNGGQAGAGAAAPEGGAGSGNSGGETTMAGAAGESAAGAGGEAGVPSTPGPVIVFDAGPHNGLNFGGRLGLDAHCATAKATKSIPGAVTHAFISVSATDEIRDMPTLYAVPTNREFVGPTGSHLADNWADLLDGNVDQSLSEAGISNAQFWISGSNTDGSVRSTCNGWTTSEFSQQVTGTYGYPTSKDSLWITIVDGDVYCSASQYNVMCLAYWKR